MMNLPRLSVGIDDFKELRDGQFWFVDKSLWIEEVIRDPAKAMLITRPRRFGKTLNLSMLHYFFEGRYRSEQPRWFDTLKIADAEEAILKHRGAHPVITLSLKSIHAESMEEAMDHLINQVCRLFHTHHYLLESERLSAYDKAYIERLIQRQANRAEYEHSLFQLSSLLHQHWQQQVVILIDEYDTPIQQAYLKGYYRPMLDTMRRFLGEALKDNPCVFKVVMTGILRVAKESLFSGLNNIRTYSVLDQAHTQHFGFLEDEVAALLDAFHQQDHLENVRHWYNGYSMGHHRIYNPWSVMNAMTEQGCQLSHHWTNSGEHTLLRDLLARVDGSTKMHLKSLILREDIQVDVDEEVVFPELGQDRAHTWGLMLAIGYVTGTVESQTHGLRCCRLRIPNEEVVGLYHRLIRGWFSHQGYQDLHENWLASLLNGKVFQCQEALSRLVLNTMSYFDVQGQQPERVYHAFVLGMLVQLHDRYQVLSNRESGLGRFDVMLIPEDRTQAGCVLEFKVAEDSTKLDDVAQQALLQIERQEYIQNLRQAGVTTIHQWGLAFHGKKVWVAYRQAVLS